jgi:hypothetical protein
MRKSRSQAFVGLQWRECASCQQPDLIPEDQADCERCRKLAAVPKRGSRRKAPVSVPQTKER